MSFFKELFRRRELLNPSIFNDDMAFNTKWTPLKRGGTNFKTHKMVFLEGAEVKFAPTAGAYLLPMFIAVGGFIPLLTSNKNDYFGSALPTMFYILPIFFLTLAIVVIRFIKPIVFSGLDGVFYKGKRPEIQSDKPSKNFALLNDIYALQLIRERVSSGKSNYTSYELNLVLKNGYRINVVDHGDLSSIRADAAQLANFLKVPVWDAVDYRV